MQGHHVAALWWLRQKWGIIVILASPLLLPVTGQAQCTPGGPLDPPARRGALVGIVMDSAHRIIEGASVVVASPPLEARTGADGRFLIEGVAPGRYQLSVRRFGYQMAVQEHYVTEDGGIARVCLVPRTTSLAPVITSAKRLGLSGFIGDSALQPLPGAEVSVVATRHPVLTDPSGGFHIPLRPGTYSVLVSKSGYGQRLLSVTIPKDSGREIAVWLGSVQRNPNRMAAAYDDMRMRLQTANANRSRLLSDEDLARTQADLRMAAQMAVTKRIPRPCFVIVDGGPAVQSLDLISKESIAMMEVHIAKPPRYGPTSLDPRGTSGGGVRTTVGATRGGCPPFEIYVWMK